MSNFFEKYWPKIRMELFRKKALLVIVIILLIAFWVIAYLDRGLAVGLSLLIFLTAITFLILWKIGIKDKTLYSLFLIVLLIHFGAVLFIHYAHFQPFSGGGGDYIAYNYQAQEIAQRIHQGDFSLQGLNLSHYYPVIIGVIYALTLPEMIIGQLFGVWLAALSVLLVYLIVLEIGGSKNWAFLIGLIVNIYPSYLFYGSLLLKDALVVPLALAGLLLTLKLIKNFSWRNFLIFYIILAGLIHFRFYIGYALLFTFILCWLLFSNLNLRKKIIYAMIIIPLLGFLPQISGYGYYGINPLKYYLSPQRITYYREVVYAPPLAPALKTPASPPSGAGSTITVETELNKPLSFLGNYLKSFSYVLLGPFPWQMKYSRHLFALFETIPWYFLFFFIVKGAIKSIRNYRVTLPLILFSLGTLAILTLFVPNLGIITRIRIPSFIALLCLIPFAFNFQNKYLENIKNYLNKLWQNI